VYTKSKLGDISLDVRYGLTETARNTGTHRFIRITDLTEAGQLKQTKAKYVSPTIEAISKFEVRRGDILIARSGSVGRPHLFDSNSACVFASYLIRFRIDERLADPHYVFYYALSPDYREYIGKQRRGGAIKNINAKQLRELPIPVPPLQEQRRIVGRIKECMARVDEIEALRGNGHAETKAFLRSFYHDLYETLVASRTTRPFESCGDIRGGGTPSKKRKDYWDGSIPWVSPREMKFRDIHETSLSISEQATRETSVKPIERPSVLFVVRGMILAHTLPVAVNRVPVTLNQDMKAISPKMDINVDYLATMLRGAERRLLRKIDIAGHGTRRLQTEHWKSLPIPELNLVEQQVLVSKVESVESAADALSADMNAPEVSQLRQSILRKAFAGEL
jgi:type I restriction enzyme, S subunit